MSKKKNKVSSGLKNYIRGSQILSHNILMFGQATKKQILYVGALALCFMLFFMYLLVDQSDISVMVATLKALPSYFMGRDSSMVSFTMPSGAKAKLTVGDIMSNQVFTDIRDMILTYLFWVFILTVFLSIAAIIIISKLLSKKGDTVSSEEIIRGATLASNEEVISLIKKRKQASDMSLADIPILKNSEVKHFCAHGTTGTGKSLTVMDMLDQLRDKDYDPDANHEDEKRAMIFDDGGDYVSKYYCPERGDKILNPLDTRCPNWDLWEECQTLSDFENFSKDLIPEQGEKDPFWLISARRLVADVAFKLGQNNERNIERLLQVLLNIPLETLQKLIQNCPAEQLVDKSIAKTAATIRAVITNYVAPLRFLIGLNKEGKETFTIREWIMDEEDHHAPWLFITTNDEIHDSINPLISMWMAMASRRMKSLEKNRLRRIYYFLDEVAKLKKVNGLLATLQVIRNFGGCFFLGIQSKALLQSIYGRDEATAIMDLLNTQLYLRSTDESVAEAASRQLGEQDVKESVENYAYGHESTRDGIQIGKQSKTKRIVTYTEMQMLDDCEGYLKLPGSYPRTKVSFKHKERKKIAEHFLMRELPETENINQKIKENKLTMDLTEYHDSLDSVIGIIPSVNADIEETIKAASQPPKQNQTASEGGDEEETRDSDKEQNGTTNNKETSPPEKQKQTQKSDQDKTVSRQQEKVEMEYAADEFE